MESVHPGPFHSIFDLPCWGGQNQKKSRLHQNAARGWFAIWDTYYGAYFCGIHIPPAPPRLPLLPRQMWTRWSETPQFRSKAVSKRSDVMLPHSTDIYLQAPIFFTPTSGGPPLLHSNRDFGVDLHLGRVPLQTFLIPGVS